MLVCAPVCVCVDVWSTGLWWLRVVRPPTSSAVLRPSPQHETAALHNSNNREGRKEGREGVRENRGQWRRLRWNERGSLCRSDSVLCCSSLVVSAPPTSPCSLLFRALRLSPSELCPSPGPCHSSVDWSAVDVDPPPSSTEHAARAHCDTHDQQGWTDSQAEHEGRQKETLDDQTVEATCQCGTGTGREDREGDGEGAAEHEQGREGKEGAKSLARRQVRARGVDDVDDDNDGVEESEEDQLLLSCVGK
jgi:hypothetical protein